MTYHRYWVTFERINKPTPLNLGCGVTAYDQGDAIALMQRYIFGHTMIPAIANVITDVEMDDLDQHHVVPNVGDVSIRGIWFPQGYGGQAE